MIKTHQATLMNGDHHALSVYQNDVLLIVNTASKCGYTPQFEGLQSLYKTYQAQGFTVLAFPCNQFKDQDPEDNATIHTFCQTHFGVTFPVYQKVDVNGEGAHPLFKALKAATGGAEIRWNFEKFLIAKDGTVIQRYPTQTPPEAIKNAIEEALHDNH